MIELSLLLVAVTFGAAAGFHALGHDTAKAVSDSSTILDAHRGAGHADGDQREARLPAPEAP